MDVTPQLLKEVEFREKFRGYDPDEVDDFLGRVGLAFAQLQEKLRESSDQVESANARAARAEARARDSSEADETLRRTLVLAQRTADAAIKDAEERAAAIVAAAEAQARQQVATVEERGAQTQKAADDAARRRLDEADARAAERLRDSETQADQTLGAAREQASRLLVDARQKADRFVAEAETAAVREAEARLTRVTAEAHDLEQRRDALAHDARALELHTEDQRTRLQAALESLQNVVGGTHPLGALPLPALRSTAVADAASAAAAVTSPTAPATVSTPEASAVAPPEASPGSATALSVPQAPTPGQEIPSERGGSERAVPPSAPDRATADAEGPGALPSAAPIAAVPPPPPAASGPSASAGSPSVGTSSAATLPASASGAPVTAGAEPTSRPVRSGDPVGRDEPGQAARPGAATPTSEHAGPGRVLARTSPVEPADIDLTAEIPDPLTAPTEATSPAAPTTRLLPGPPGSGAPPWLGVAPPPPPPPPPAERASGREAGATGGSTPPPPPPAPAVSPTWTPPSAAAGVGTVAGAVASTATNSDSFLQELRRAVGEDAVEQSDRTAVKPYDQHDEITSVGDAVGRAKDETLRFFGRKDSARDQGDDSSADGDSSKDSDRRS